MYETVCARSVGPVQASPPEKHTHSEITALVVATGQWQSARPRPPPTVIRHRQWCGYESVLHEPVITNCCLGGAAIFFFLSTIWSALSGGMSGDDIRDPHVLPSDVLDVKGPLQEVPDDVAHPGGVVWEGLDAL